MSFDNVNVYLLVILNASFTGLGVALGNWAFKSFFKKKLDYVKDKIKMKKLKRIDKGD
jgi:hypothetical protein